VSTSASQCFLFCTQMSTKKQVWMEALCPWQASLSLCVEMEMERVRHTHTYAQTGNGRLLVHHGQLWVCALGVQGGGGTRKPSSYPWLCVGGAATISKSQRRVGKRRGKPRSVSISFLAPFGMAGQSWSRAQNTYSLLQKLGEPCLSPTTFCT